VAKREGNATSQPLCAARFSCDVRYKPEAGLRLVVVAEIVWPATGRTAESQPPKEAHADENE